MNFKQMKSSCLQLFLEKMKELNKKQDKNT